MVEGVGSCGGEGGGGGGGGGIEARCCAKRLLVEMALLIGR